MLLMSARVRPWYARDARSSDERVQTTLLPSSATFTPISGRWVYESLPSLPSTVIARLATFTFTPPGTEIGFLPIRDMLQGSGVRGQSFNTERQTQYHQTSHRTSPPKFR